MLMGRIREDGRFPPETTNGNTGTAAIGVQLKRHKKDKALGKDAETRLRRKFGPQSN